jgi:3-oxoacyl-[acyl-carrier protein] reductase
MSKNCLITGASRGLGKFLSKTFFDNGYNLILISRNVVDTSDFQVELALNSERKVVTLQCDLSSQLEISSLSEVVSQKYEVDVLINNAAIHGEIGPFKDFSDSDSWSKTFNVNFFSPVELTRAVIPGMLSRGMGSIINISGGGAATLRANFSQYATSKAALIKFSETISNELRADGVRINCISPGMMATDLLKEVIAKGSAVVGDFEYDNAVKGLNNNSAQMESVANLALFLAGDKSIGISGKLISATWDKWKDWAAHLHELDSDLYTLRRMTARDRGYTWGDL